jgi:hypothetical protein
LKSKAGKIVLAVVMLAAAAFFGYRALRHESPVVSRLQFVDVTTGDVFDLEMSQVAMIPAKSPKTGQFTLLPCKKDEHGVLRVTERYRNSLAQDLKTENKSVDPVTLEVRKTHGG